MEKQAEKKDVKKKTEHKKQGADQKNSISVSLKTISTKQTSSDKNHKKTSGNSGTKKQTQNQKQKPNNSGVKKTESKQSDAKKQSISSKSKNYDQKTKSSDAQPLGERIKYQLKKNYLLWITLIIIAIPCIILAYILIGSREGSTSPVVGSRFDNALDPEITTQDLNALKESLQFEDAQAIEINLKSATLRITIDTRDDMTQEEMNALLVSAYDKVVEKLPVATYFTNQKRGEGEEEDIVKMYDLEISVYNFIPENEEQKASQIHLSRSKNAASEELIDDVLTSPRDEQSANDILHPDTSEPPVSEENTEGE